MFATGTETPFVIPPRAPVAPGVSVSHLNSSDYDAGSQTGRLADSVDLTAQGRARLENSLYDDGRGEYSRGPVQSYTDFQEFLEDENRFPPGLLRMLRDLYEKVGPEQPASVDISA